MRYWQHTLLLREIKVVPVEYKTVAPIFIARIMVLLPSLHEMARSCFEMVMEDMMNANSADEFNEVMASLYDACDSYSVLVTYKV